LINDSDVDGDSVSVSSAGSTSVNGGRVTVNTDGSFVYTPPSGFNGTDKFTYTVSDGTGLTATGTTSVSVSDMVWYVDNTANATGADGTDYAPYPNLNDTSQTATSGDVIYVDYGDGSMSGYDAGFTLPSGVDLNGEGSALVVSGQLLRSAGSRPLIGYSGGQAVTPITANGGNTITGIELDATASWYGLLVSTGTVYFDNSEVHPLLVGVYSFGDSTTYVTNVDFTGTSQLPTYSYGVYAYQAKAYISSCDIYNAWAGVLLDEVIDASVTTSNFVDNDGAGLWVIDPQDNSSSKVTASNNLFKGMIDDGTAGVYIDSQNQFGALDVSIINNTFDNLFTDALLVEMNAGQVDLTLDISSNVFTDIVGDGVRIELQSIQPDYISVRKNTFKNIATRNQAIDVNAYFTNTVVSGVPIMILENTATDSDITVFSEQQKPNEFEVIVDGNYLAGNLLEIYDNSSVWPGTRASLSNNSSVTTSMVCGNYLGGLEVGLITNDSGKFVFDAPQQSCRYFGLGGTKSIGSSGYDDFGNMEVLGNTSGTGAPYLDIRAYLTIADINTLP